MPIRLMPMIQADGALFCSSGIALPVPIRKVVRLRLGYTRPPLLHTSSEDISSDYVAKFGAPDAAVPRIFFRYYLVNTAIGEKSGPMLAECKWTAGE